MERGKGASSETGLSRRTRFFLGLLTLHTALLVTCTIAANKFFALPFGTGASGTVFSYVLTFVALDTIAELYGREYSRLVINFGLAAMLLSALYLQLVIWLPPAKNYDKQAALEAIMGSSFRVWLGGWVAYMISQHLDLWSFLRLKEWPLHRVSLPARAWISMVLGQMVDTSIFMTIAFLGTYPVLPMILGQFAVKLAMTTLTTPLVPLVVAAGRRYIGDEVEPQGLEEATG